jgi:hypothetical protein
MTNGGELGDLVNVERQLVAGFNYLLTFATETGVVVITVFDQSWTQTRKVTSVEVKDTKKVK